MPYDYVSQEYWDWLERTFKAMEGLTTGRIVHYGALHKAAIVSTIVNKAQGIVDLHVFDNSLSYPVVLVRGVHYSKEPTAKTWHWIEKA